ncbi:MAG: hypothetical protein GX974_08200 [Clostridiales bacterium]|nr:hypothetical protein [Clostridiales bacterium]
MDNRSHKAVHVEDTAEALVKFENGALYQLYACNVYPIDAPIQIEIVGDKGKAGLVQDTAWVHLDGEERYEIEQNFEGVAVGPSYWGTSHVLQIQDFYGSIIEDRPFCLNGKEGRKALELVLGIYQSARLNKKIELPFKDLIDHSPL